MPVPDASPAPPGAVSARLAIDARNTPGSAFLLGLFVAAHGEQTADWYAALEAEPAHAVALQTRLADEAFLRVSVQTEHGWIDQGLLWEVGPELVKRQVVPLDLSGVAGDVVRIRLDAPASFWLVDFVGLDTGAAPAFSVRTLGPGRVSDRRAGDSSGLLAAADGRDLRLESRRHAEERGAVRHAVLCGYGLVSEAYSQAAPDPSGAGVQRATMMALGESDDPAWIKAHGTGTRAGDEAEYRGLASVFGSRLRDIPVTGLKSTIGHCLGASGRAAPGATVTNN